MNIKRIIAWLLVTVLFVQITACGTILHPERRGQSAAGGIDVKIALLDGVGLFFGFVPGVIAFAVDFNNGAIYLPANGSHSLAYRSHTNGNSNFVSHDDTTRYQIIRVSQDQLTQAGIEQIIYQETGKHVNLSDDDVKFTQLDNIDQVESIN